MARELFYVGFYSRSEPHMLQRWRPKTDSPENVSHKLATKRFDRLVERMKAGTKVDNLRVASVALFNANGDAIHSMTSDGTEALPKPEDATRFLQTKRVRGQA